MEHYVTQKREWRTTAALLARRRGSARCLGPRPSNPSSCTPALVACWALPRSDCPWARRLRPARRRLSASWTPLYRFPTMLPRQPRQAPLATCTPVPALCNRLRLGNRGLQRATTAAKCSSAPFKATAPLFALRRWTLPNSAAHASADIRTWRFRPRAAR